MFLPLNSPFFRAFGAILNFFTFPPFPPTLIFFQKSHELSDACLKVGGFNFNCPVVYRRFTNLVLPGRGQTENSKKKRTFFLLRVFRIFGLIGWCSKCDFWNPGEILHRHRCSDFFGDLFEVKNVSQKICFLKIKKYFTKDFLIDSIRKSLVKSKCSRFF